MASREMTEGLAGVARRPAAAAERGEIVSIDLRQDPPAVEYGTRRNRLEVRSRPLADSRWSVLAALVVLNALDVVSTMAVLAAGGTERNPLMRPLMDGVWPAVLVKAAVLMLVAWLLARCADSRRVEVLMAFAAGWYFAVVSWNVTVLALA